MNQLIKFSGGVQNSDSANTKNAIVERDSNKQINISTVNADVVVIAPVYNLGSVAYTTTATIDVTQAVILLNATGGAFTATLPPVATSTGLHLTFVKTDSSGNLPTVKGNATELINGANTYTGLSAQYNSVRLFCDGTKWFTV